MGKIREKKMTDIGIVLTTRDDFDGLDTCVQSIQKTTCPFELIVVDASVSDLVEKYCEKASIEYQWSRNNWHLTRALNTGIKYFLDKEDIKFVTWYHIDMNVLDDHLDWLEKLKEYLVEHKDVGRVASSNSRDGVKEERPGNELPCMWKKEILQKIWDRDGNCFDEGFRYIGGCEDWCINRKVMDLGYKVMITPTSVVYHQGAGTRFRRDTTEEQIYNRTYYYKKYGTDQPPV